eukprot:1644584-Amphidinium_carterae.1
MILPLHMHAHFCDCDTVTLGNETNKHIPFPKDPVVVNASHKHGTNEFPPLALHNGAPTKLAISLSGLKGA